MKKYRYEAKFQNRMRFENNKGTVWDTDKLNELSSWEIDGTGLNAAEV